MKPQGHCKPCGRTVARLFSIRLDDAPVEVFWKGTGVPEGAHVRRACWRCVGLIVLWIHEASAPHSPVPGVRIL